MKTSLLVIFCFLNVCVYAQTVEKVDDPVEWINPLMGSDLKI
jgi:hypothetical protein